MTDFNLRIKADASEAGRAAEQLDKLKKSGEGAGNTLTDLIDKAKQAKAPLGDLGNAAGDQARKTDTAAGAMRRYSGGLSGITAVVRSFLPILAGGVIATSLISTARGANQYGETILRAARETATGVEAMSLLESTGRAADVQLKSITQSLAELNKTTSRASAGNKEASATLMQLGLSADFLKGLDTETRLEQIADALVRVRDPADRARLGNELLSSSYAELLPLLEGGAAGFRRLVEEQKRLGNFASEEDVRRFAAMDDSIKQMGIGWDAFKRKLVSKLPVGAFAKDFERMGRSLQLWAGATPGPLFGQRAAEFGDGPGGRGRTGGDRGLGSSLDPGVIAETARDMAKDAENAKGAAREAEQIRKAQLGVDVAAIQRALDAEVDAYDRQGDLLSARRAVNLVSERDYYAGQRQLIEATTAAKIDALNAENARLAADRTTGVAAMQIQDRMKANDAEILKLKAAQLTQLEKIDTAVEGAGRKATASYDSLVESSNAYLKNLEEQYDREIALHSLGKNARETGAGLSDIEDRLRTRKRQIEDDARNFQIEDDVKAKQLRVAEEEARQEVEIYQRSRQKLLEVQADWSTGARRALNNYLDDARNVAAATDEAMSNALHGGEEALLDFATKGKASWKDLADSAIRDIVRIELKAATSSIFGGGGVGSLLSGLFGKGGSGTQSAASYVSTFFGGPRAAGGPVDAGRAYLVGEKGPELVIPRRNGMVVPNNQLGGGEVNIHIHGAPSQPKTSSSRNPNGGLDIKVVFDQIENHIADSMGRGGKVAQAAKVRFGLREQVG